MIGFSLDILRVPCHYNFRIRIMADKKDIPVALLDILKTYTDENHILSTAQIIDKMNLIYGISMERRTLYANIELLKKYGHQISDWHDNGSGYFLKEHQFTNSEVLLLCNAIHASHFISAAESDAMIKKLLDTQSTFEQRNFRDSVYLPNPKKTDNKTLLQNIRVLSKAIQDRRSVKFVYLHYNKEKKLEPRREKLYDMQPRFIVFLDSRAYIVVTSDHHPGFGHYRIDRMKKVELGENTFPALRDDIDAYQYAANRYYMYTDAIISASFRCRYSVLDHMIDIFGTGFTLIPYNDDYFDMHVRGSGEGLLLLAQQYIDSITILEPEELRNNMKERLAQAQKNYSD